MIAQQVSQLTLERTGSAARYRRGKLAPLILAARRHPFRDLQPEHLIERAGSKQPQRSVARSKQQPVHVETHETERLGFKKTAKMSRFPIGA